MAGFSPGYKGEKVLEGRAPAVKEASCHNNAESQCKIRAWAAWVL